MDIDEDIKEALEAAQQVAGPSDLARVFEALESAADGVFECEEFYIMRVVHDGQLVVSVGAESYQFSQEVLSGTGPVFLTHLEMPDDSPFFNGLIVPFHSSLGLLLGAVFFADVPEPFSLGEFEGCESLATVAALAVSQSRNARRRQKQDAEMSYAWRVSKELLPRGSHRFDNYELAGLLIPHREIGGDIYDFALLGSQMIAFLIADATGKGVGPCLQVSTARAYFRALSETESELETIASTLNRLLCKDLANDKFITACFGWVDCQNNCLHYVNAGHGSIYIVDGETVAPLACPCPPLGMLEGSEFRVYQKNLEPGSLITLLTDGWTERETSSGVDYGDAALLDRLSQLSHSSAEESLRALYQDFEVVCHAFPKRDDVTALLIRRIE